MRSEKLTGMKQHIISTLRDAPGGEPVDHIANKDLDDEIYHQCNVGMNKSKDTNHLFETYISLNLMPILFIHMLMIPN